MRRSTRRYLIRADLYRLTERVDTKTLVKSWFVNPNMRFMVVFRTGVWARATPGHRLARLVTSFLYRRYSVRYGIEMPFATPVGPGLRINHWVGGIVVNPRARLGSAVTLTPGVVIGNNAPALEAATIGDRVILNVGCKVIGGITVGHDSQVGANAVVIRDVPPKSVAAGVPARVIDGAVPAPSWYLDFERLLGPIPDDAPGQG